MTLTQSKQNSTLLWVKRARCRLRTRLLKMYESNFCCWIQYPVGMVTSSTAIPDRIDSFVCAQLQKQTNTHSYVGIQVCIVVNDDRLTSGTIDMKCETDFYRGTRPLYANRMISPVVSFGISQYQRCIVRAFEEWRNLRPWLVL